MGEFRRIREPKFTPNDLKIEEDDSAAEIQAKIIEILLRYENASAFVEKSAVAPTHFHCQQCLQNLDDAVDIDDGQGISCMDSFLSQFTIFPKIGKD